FGSLIGKRLPQPGSISLWSAMQLLCGGLTLCIVAASSGEASQLKAAPLHALLAVAYLIVFSSWLGFGAYVWLLARVPAAQLSSYAFVNPLVAVLLGHLVLAEPLTCALGQAAIAILLGVMLLHGDMRRS
ncbi:MAG TPA: EamA family transporter, partial [Polyangiales bacterium]|nr:EamA family transporter [Polyangiales bacterium]